MFKSFSAVTAPDTNSVQSKTAEHTATPQDTRDTIRQAHQKRQNMVERQQPVPVLKPQVMGVHEADRQFYRQQLQKEQQLNTRAQAIYHRPLDSIDISAKTRQTNVISDDFNMNTAQDHDMKQIGWS